MPDHPLDEWLAHHRLPKPRLFAGGYDADHVDQRLDEVIDRMRRSAPFSDLVDRPRFPAAKGSGAYDARAVDDLFDNLKWGSDPRE